jgi:preprotein translocase subunit SecE
MGKISAFWDDMKKEMAKVSWPTRPELQESTMVVVVYTIVISVVIFSIDQVYSFITDVLYR